MVWKLVIVLFALPICYDTCSALSQRSGACSMRERPAPGWEGSGSGRSLRRARRGVAELLQSLRCGARCPPLALRGHGCFCGFAGGGAAVDAADRCCQRHDACYARAEGRFCPPFAAYLRRYRWTCRAGTPLCLDPRGNGPGPWWCMRDLCECDRSLTICLSHAPCPSQRALCRTDTLRLFKQLLLG